MSKGISLYNLVKYFDVRQHFTFWTIKLDIKYSELLKQSKQSLGGFEGWFCLWGLLDMHWHGSDSMDGIWGMTCESSSSEKER